MVKIPVRLGVIGLVAAFGLLLSACAGAAPSAGQGPVNGELVLKAAEWKFTPASIQLRAGEKVTIVLQNDGKTVHDVDLASLGVKLRAEPGKSDRVEVTPSKSGAYEFACTLPGHREAGMVGKFSVSS